MVELRGKLYAGSEILWLGGKLVEAAGAAKAGDTVI